MDTQDFRSLQEAYMEVYRELDEGEKPLLYGRMMKKSNELASTDDKTKQKRAAKIYTAANTPKGPKIKVKEQVDLYDIILSHLLDEGYAETQEQAEVMMVNMSEEWREEIVEAKVDNELSGQRKKQIRNERRFGTNSSYSKSKATKERHKLHTKKRGASKTKGDKSGEKDASVLAQSAMVHRLNDRL
jgi:hypothetical protein